MRAVEPSGCVEQTYELAVDDVHEFFANGIVVANCSDADLYISRHLTHHQFRSPPPAASALERAEAHAEDFAEQATAIALADRDESDGWEPVERDY